MEDPRISFDHRKWRTVLDDVVEFARERNVTTIAAGLAFHALNALVPTVILLLIGLVSLGQLNSLAPFVGQLVGFESGTLDGVTRQMTDAGGGRLRASLVAGGIFLWSAGRLFEEVQDSFAEVYDTEPYDSWSRKLVGIALTLGTILVGFVAMAILGVWLSNLVDGLLWRVVSPFLLLAALSVLFVPLYYLLPDADGDVREAVPGAVFAAFGWALSAVAFRAYASISSSVELYGALGALVLFMSWIYAGSLLLLLGVVLNAVVADRLHVTDAR